MTIKREDSTYDRKNAIYRPGVPRPLSPDHKFRSEDEKNTFPTVGEFWSWAYSDLKENTSRGVLAEFLVASALGIVGETKAGWEPYDLRTSSGTRVEVKASGYLQAWATTKHSNINFSSLKTQICCIRRIHLVYFFDRDPFTHCRGDTPQTIPERLMQ